MALVVRALVPAMPWAPAIALGAIVAPPDAVAATAVLRQLRPPQRMLTILEGESLLNDATALLDLPPRRIGAVAASGFSVGDVAPAFLLAVAGSLIVGPALGWLTLRLMARVQHVPTAIILQFVTTFGVWMLAEHLGLSAVLTMVCYAATAARTAPSTTPARMRIPTYAVWETVVFALNILAFIFIGLQIRPILATLEPAERGRYFAVSGAVLLTVIVVRLAWHMSFNAVIRWRDRRTGSVRRARCCAPPSAAAWSSRGPACGHRLAGGGAGPPAGFPYPRPHRVHRVCGRARHAGDPGATLKPLLRALELNDDDPVGGEVRAARDRALEVSLATVAHDQSPAAKAVRQELAAHFAPERVDTGSPMEATHDGLRRAAIDAARQAVLDMRASDEIGDDAFHLVEEELDWLEMAGRSTTR